MPQLNLPCDAANPLLSYILSDAHVAIRHCRSSRKPPPNTILSLAWTLIRQVEPGRPPATTAHALLQRAPDLPVPRFVFVVVVARAGRVPLFHPTLNNTFRAEIPVCNAIGAISSHPRIFEQCYIVKALLDPNIRTSLHGPAGQCGYAKKRLRSIPINLAMLIFASCACKPSAGNPSDDADTCDCVTAVSEVPDGYRMLDLPAFSGSVLDGTLEYKALVWSSAGT